MSVHPRRFFWGHSLAQAVVSAARWYGVAPERLAYRVLAKRHGFVKMRRPYLIEVDPEAPERGEDAGGSTGEETAGSRPSPSVARSRLAERGPLAPPGEGRDPAHRPAEGSAGASRGERRARGDRPAREDRPRRQGRRADEDRPRRERPETEAWSAPDEESELAALEASSRLLRLAGLELAARVRRSEERLEVELAGADEERLAGLGVAFLDDLEHLLPRTVHGLCGRLVRIRVEGAGLRAAREAELRARARELAERVLASGAEELTEPLDPGERRIVHLELAERPGVRTESVGGGLRRRVRIASES